MFYRPTKTFLAVGAAVAIAAPAALAMTLESRAPNVAFEDAGGHAVSLPTPGHSTLIFYEDKDAGKQNQHTRDIVGPITDRPENRAKLAFMAVADLEKWNWFPARQYALKELHKVEKKESITLYCDWHGVVRKAWNLTKGKSGIILLDDAGAVRFFGEGPLAPAQTEDLVRQLTALGVKTQ